MLQFEENWVCKVKWLEDSQGYCVQAACAQSTAQLAHQDSFQEQGSACKPPAFAGS